MGRYNSNKSKVLKKYSLTFNQLKKWNLKFDKLIMCKPRYDILIDDKGSTIDNWNAAGGTGIFYQNADQVINDLKKLGL